MKHSIKKAFYFDVETTGLSAYRNDIVQLAGCVEIEGEEVERFNIMMQPTSYENVDDKALQVQNRTLEEIKTFQPAQKAYHEILDIMDRYINKFDKSDKFHVIGYNTRFDVDFLTQFFKKHHNNFLFSYFGTILDPLAIIRFLTATGKCNIEMKDHKLETVCNAFGIKIDAHDAFSDILATKELFKMLDREIMYSPKGENHHGM